MAVRPSRAKQKGSVRVALPVAPGALVGRAPELDDLEAQLDAGARLITLVGPPGTGKTRLALALAERTAARGRHRLIAFVDLTPYTAQPSAIARTASGSAV